MMIWKELSQEFSYFSFPFYVSSVLNHNPYLHLLIQTLNDLSAFCHVFFPYVLCVSLYLISWTSFLFLVKKTAMNQIRYMFVWVLPFSTTLRHLKIILRIIVFSLQVFDIETRFIFYCHKNILLFWWLIICRLYYIYCLVTYLALFFNQFTDFNEIFIFCKCRQLQITWNVKMLFIPVHLLMIT